MEPWISKMRRPDAADGAYGEDLMGVHDDDWPLTVSHLFVTLSIYHHEHIKRKQWYLNTAINKQYFEGCSFPTLWGLDQGFENFRPQTWDSAQLFTPRIKLSDLETSIQVKTREHWYVVSFYSLVHRVTTSTCAKKHMTNLFPMCISVYTRFCFFWPLWERFSYF